MARRGKVNRRAAFEMLEHRRLLATDNWISVSSGSWDVASNWSTGKVPGATDDVVINVPGASPTVTIGSNVESVASITTADPLVISGGGLTVTADSTIGGGLAMTGGSLAGNGSGVSLSVTGTTTVSGANLYAQGGATLGLPQLTGYAGGVDHTSAFQATGAGSVLALPKLATVTEDTGQYYSLFQVQALAGGNVQIPALTTISGGPVTLESDGAGSNLDVSALSSFKGTSGKNVYASLQATHSGTVLDPSLTTIDHANLTLDGTGTIALRSLRPSRWGPSP